jgi:hypothetical protein
MILKTYLVAFTVIITACGNAQKWKGNYDSVSEKPSEGFYQVKANGLWGFVDEKGKVLKPCVFLSVTPFSEGMAVVKTSRLNLLDAKGNLIPLSRDYRQIMPFHEGLALVSAAGNLSNASNKYLYGFIDKTGREVIPTQFPYALSFSEGLAVARDANGKDIFINRSGNKAFEGSFSVAYSFSNGAANVGMPVAGDAFATDYFLIDKTGKPLTEKFEQMNLYGNFYRVQKNRKWGLVSRAGKTLVEPVYEYINESNFRDENGSYKGYSEGVLTAKLNGKWGMTDTAGKVLVAFSFDRIDAFNEGLSPAYQNGKGGYMNKRGVFVIPAVYKAVYPFNKGYAWASAPGGCAIINKTGKAICPFKYEPMGSHMEAVFFDNGLAAVKRNNKIGFINTEGREVIPCIYDFEPMGNHAGFFNGKARVKLNGKQLTIDTNGNEIK